MRVLSQYFHYSRYRITFLLSVDSFFVYRLKHFTVFFHEECRNEEDRQRN